MSAEARKAAVALAERFLIALEARDLDVARGCWAGDEVQIVAVGGRLANDLDDYVAGSAHRYQRVGKHRLEWDAWETADGWRVLSRGLLHGILLDGTPFDGVRYVDLFDIVDGRITRQEIWNDFGAARPTL